MTNKQKTESKNVKKKTTKKVTKKKTTTRKSSRGKVSTEKEKDLSQKKEASSATKQKSRTKKPNDVQVKDARKIVYDVLDVFIYEKDHEQSEGPLTVALAKQYLGWTEETENIKFKNDYMFKDRNGNKIRCHNNVTNRPFDPKLAEDWMYEILRKKWRMNGETIIIDKKALIHNGQHRLVGLIWAEQERLKNTDKWKRYWKEPCYLVTVMVVGVEHDDQTINTIDTGKKRTMADVIYRSPFFEDLVSRDRKKAAKVCEFCVKTLWWRTGAKERSFTPKLPHSESLEFIENHKNILECVKFIWEENSGKERRIEKYISMGMASALLYMMGACKTDMKYHDEDATEQNVDWSTWDKAQEFFIQFAGGEEFKVLRDYLTQEAARWREVGPAIARNVAFGSIIKSWNLFVEDKKLTKKNIAVKVEEDKMGIFKVLETPSIGGVDLAAD